MSEKRDFWFNYGGDWDKQDDGTWLFNGSDSELVSAEVSNMSFERIVQQYTDLGFSNPKGIYFHDPEKSFEEGLYVLNNEESVRKMICYMLVLDWTDINFFIDHENMIMPAFTTCTLPCNNMHCEGRIEVDRVEGIDDIGNRLHEDDRVEGIDEDGLDIEGAESRRDIIVIPTQCSRARLYDTSYVNPIGYETSDVDENEEHDDFVCEDEEDSSDSDFVDDENDELRNDFPFTEVPEGVFKLGQTFLNVHEARIAINEFGVKHGYKLKFVKNEKDRLRVICVNSPDCPFKLLVSKDGDRGGMAVKTVVMKHKCFRQRAVPSATSMFIARYFKSTIYRNPKFRCMDMQTEIEKHLKTHVSVHKCKRAKQVLMHELEGSFKHEFAIVGAYAEKVKESNPGSKFEIELCKDELEKGKRVFKRAFVMLDACKKNWLGGCRRIISLDGCFFKGVCEGMLLTAVGRDGDDKLVPIAWAVVSHENKVNWRWFMCWLRQELELGDGSTITIMSDMQKGLIHAVEQILPKAEHRWCARHIYANWSKKWSGGELKKRFWICAWSTFEEDFISNLSKVGEVNKQAAEELLKYPPQAWCRAFQSDRCCAYTVDNNISESWNSCLLEARHKPIMTMLEEIRIHCMSRIKDRKFLCDSWINEWSPAAMLMFEENKEAAVGCKVLWNGASGYEIGEGQDKHTILLDKGSCTCRCWELTGIPCMHAISAMYYNKIDPMSKISKWYHKSTYMKAYEHTICPVPGVKFFRVKAHPPIEPPPKKKQPGRPRKKRIRASNEKTSNKSKLTRKAVEQKCSLCKTKGHNKKSCSGNASQANTADSSAQTSRPQKHVPRRHYKASKPTTGKGCHVDVDSGRITLNPGLSSQRIIMEGHEAIPHESDPIVRGAIPNEKEIRHKKRDLRQIQFRGAGSEVRITTSLPFKAPGLKWKGAPSITTNQLLEQRSRKRSRSGQSSASTTTNLES